MRARHALVPLIGTGKDGDAYRPDIPAGTCWAGSIPTDKHGHPVADQALVHLWGDDRKLGELDALDGGLVLDIPLGARIDEVAANERKRWRELLRDARRPVDLRAGMQAKHLVRAAGQALEPWFHELNLRAGLPELAGGALDFYDNFTGAADSALSSHTSDSGHTWTQDTQFGVSNMPLISNANRVRGVGGTSAVYSSFTPGGAEYDVGFDVKWFTNVACFAGVLARLDTAAATRYIGYFRLDLNEAHIYKYVAGTATDLGVWTAAQQDYTGNVFRVRNATKQLIVAGVTQISTTDNAISSAGRVGLYLYTASNSTGVHLDNLTYGAISTATGTDSGTGSDSSGAGPVVGTNPVTGSDTGTGSDSSVSVIVPVAVPGPTNVGGDTFVDTTNVTLQTHTPTGPYAGGTWSRFYDGGASADLVISTAGRARVKGTVVASTTVDYRHSATVADGSIEGTLVVAGSSGVALLQMRCAGTLGTQNAYQFQLDGGGAGGTPGTLKLSKVVGGSSSLLATDTTTLTGAYPVPAGAYDAKLECVGSAIKAYIKISGVWTLIFSVTDTSLTTGVCALQCNSSDPTSESVGIQFDDIIIYSGVASTATMTDSGTGSDTSSAPTVSTTAKSASDTATGADAHVTLLVQFGGVADDFPLLLGGSGIGAGTDAGTGADTGTVTVGIGVTSKAASDTGTGTEARALALTLTKTATDTGIGVDSSGSSTVPSVVTYTRPFLAPLDVLAVSAPLDVAAGTAPLDLTYTED